MSHSQEPEPFAPLAFQRFRPEEQLDRARAFHAWMQRRRSVRDFSLDPVPRELVELAVRTAGTAPSGAHKQPWRFVAVTEPALKRRIREAAEIEEREFYEHRAPAEWLKDLAFLGTDWHKDFLEVAPCLLVVFRVDHESGPDGRPRKNYYVHESAGIAVGFLLAALHQSGLAALTHTPSPMKFLGELLGRPSNERAMLLIPIGFPSPQARVHTRPRKPLEEILTWNPLPPEAAPSA